MAHISTRSFILYTIALLLVWLVVIASAAKVATTKTTTVKPSSHNMPNANPIEERNNERNCKALCEHCGCLGFYCGEECICECNNENSDTECIATMQSNARKLDIPFEILIQGPSSNRFVRNAQQFEQNEERRYCAINKQPRNKRSTITIYKPTVLKHISQPMANALATAESKKQIYGVRHKRSTDHLDWLNDITSNLVRPAPLIGRAKKFIEQTVEPVVQTVANFDNSWYMDSNPQTLTRPAPLNKRQNSRGNRQKVKQRPADSDNNEDNLQNPLEKALQAVERFPRVIQKSVSNLQESNLHDIYKLNFLNSGDTNTPAGNDYFDILRQLSKSALNNNYADAIPKAPTVKDATQKDGEASKSILLPWLRNRRLLQRLQEWRKNNLRLFDK